jgi:hypothetical protein
MNSRRRPAVTRNRSYSPKALNAGFDTRVAKQVAESEVGQVLDGVVAALIQC